MQQLAAESARHPDSFNRFGGQVTAAIIVFAKGAFVSHSPGRGGKCWILHQVYLMRISFLPGDQTNPDTEWVGSLFLIIEYYHKYELF